MSRDVVACSRRWASSTSLSCTRTPTTTSAWRSSSQRAPDSPPRRHPPSTATTSSDLQLLPGTSGTTATTSSDLPLPPWTSSSAAQRQRHSATDARSGRQPDPVQRPCSRCRQQTRFESDAAICSSVRLSVCRMPQAQNGALHIILSTVLSSYSSRIHRRQTENRSSWRTWHMPTCHFS